MLGVMTFYLNKITVCLKQL